MCIVYIRHKHKLQVIDLPTHHYSLLSHNHGVEHDHLLSMVSHTEIFYL